MLFLANGLGMGAWAGSLPVLRDRVATDGQGIAVLLVVTGVCAVLSMQIGGRLGDRIGAKCPAYVSGAAMALGVVTLAWVPSYPLLLAGGALLGLGNGSMDVAMNSLGVDAERALGRGVMSRLHAFFSIGSFLGSGLVLVLTGSLGFAGAVPLASAAVLMVAMLAVAYPMTARGAIAEHHAASDAGQEPAGKPPIPRAAFVLGIMGLGFGITEGTGLDWASIHVTDVAHVDPGTGALGLVAVSATMVAIRLVGDHAVDRFGRAGVVRFGSVTASVGYLVVAFAISLPVIVGGWLLVGLGVGLIPQHIYGLAGLIGGGRVLAVVTGFGYTAFLTGPALIGFVAARVGLQHAMLVPVVSAAALTALSLRMPAEPGRR